MSLIAHLPLTTHARQRMDGRRISSAAVDAVIVYGRAVHLRGAWVHALGRREVAWAQRQGVDLRAYQDLQVVCAPNGDVITVYRNADFRSLRRSA